jgi:mono/diheme cytochrome c family protein
MKIILLPLLLLSSLTAFADDATWLADARKVATSVPPKLLQVLTDEIAKGGPESAIEVCREKAPQMAKAASEQTGWGIRRVSLQNRNPKAVPDAWERAALEDFDRRAAAGESPATLEKGEIVADGDRKEYRYMKALPVQQICVACHGPADKLKPEVTSRLQTLYPADKGTGYAIGQIRGAMTIRKAL